MTGYRQEDIDRGRVVRMKIPIDDMVKDIRAAVRVLEGGGHKVGVVGYCLGGSLAWLAATQNTRRKSRAAPCCSTGARPIGRSRPTTGRR
jgi:dienelactone hydrolase